MTVTATTPDGGVLSVALGRVRVHTDSDQAQWLRSLIDLYVESGTFIPLLPPGPEYGSPSVDDDDGAAELMAYLVGVEDELADTTIEVPPLRAGEVN